MTNNQDTSKPSAKWMGTSTREQQIESRRCALMDIMTLHYYTDINASMEGAINWAYGEMRSLTEDEIFEWFDAIGNGYSIGHHIDSLTGEYNVCIV